MRLIDADALKEVIYNNLYTITDFYNSRDRGMFWTGIEKAIDEAPTVEVALLVGERIIVGERMENDSK